MNMTLQDIGILIALALAMLGWAYQLGRSDARLGRNEKDIAELRELIARNFDKVYAKLDELPCHNPRWRMDDCR